MTHFLLVWLQPRDTAPSFSLPNGPGPMGATSTRPGSKVSCNWELREGGGGAGLSLTTSSRLDGGMQGAATCGGEQRKAKISTFHPQRKPEPSDMAPLAPTPC